MQFQSIPRASVLFAFAGIDSEGRLGCLVSLKDGACSSGRVSFSPASAVLMSIEGAPAGFSEVIPL